MIDFDDAIDEDELIEELNQYESIYKHCSPIISIQWLNKYGIESKNVSIMFTGGASGSDFEWTNSAMKKGHMVVIMSFKHHRIKTPFPLGKGLYRVNIGDSYLSSANQYIDEANDCLNRTIRKGNSTITKLIQRNWWIIHKSKMLYAIGYFQDGKRSNKISLHIKGNFIRSILI